VSFVDPDERSTKRGLSVARGWGQQHVAAALKLGSFDLRGREKVVTARFVGRERLALDDKDGEGGLFFTANNCGLDGLVIATAEQGHEGAGYLSNASRTPAATADPMTPETLGPIACISR
jgi:hypothetical protein